MCDTLIADAKVTNNNTAIFAKNSDRPPNEAQYLAWLPPRNYPGGEKVQCTYIKIPQAKETNAILLSKPFWMWGGEMGVNEHGLAIGNEAVFSKVPANKEPALLGNYPDRIGSYKEDRNELEETYIQGGFAQHQASKEERAAYTANCFQQALEVEASWLDRVQKIPEKKAFLHGSTWRKFNQEAGYL